MKRLKKKAVKVLIIIAAAWAVLFSGFTVVSHAVYHRSDMATVIEIVIRLTGTKSMFSDADVCAAFISQRESLNEVRYELPSSVTFDVTVLEDDFEGMQTYYLNKTENNDSVILYLHGGAYVNQMADLQWELCNSLASKINAEVIVPIYPLAPVHTWDQTYLLLSNLYKNMINQYDDKKIVIMGDSAGGGLAAAFCEYLGQEGINQPDNLILFSP